MCLSVMHTASCSGGFLLFAHFLWISRTNFKVRFQIIWYFSILRWRTRLVISFPIFKWHRLYCWCVVKEIVLIRAIPAIILCCFLLFMKLKNKITYKRYKIGVLPTAIINFMKIRPRVKSLVFSSCLAYSQINLIILLVCQQTTLIISYYTSKSPKIPLRNYILFFQSIFVNSRSSSRKIFRRL